MLDLKRVKGRIHDRWLKRLAEIVRPPVLHSRENVK